MGRSEEFDDPNNSREETDVVSDTYTSESADDVYRMPDVTREGTAEQGQMKPGLSVKVLQKVLNHG